MYKKGAALELQFSSARLNQGAGDPCWIDLSMQEAKRLNDEVTAFLAGATDGRAGPLIVSLDEAAQESVAVVTREQQQRSATELRQWVCVICGWIYDEAEGDPEHGIAPGTRWHEIADDWRCPLCDVGKEDFALVEF